MASPVIQMTNTQKHSGISGIPTQLMVFHSMECPLRGGYAQSVTNWANTPIKQGGPEASWHWGIDPIAIVEMVPSHLTAWHASEANPMSEGLEQAGYARYTYEEWTTPEGMKQLDNVAWLTAQRCIANGIPPVWLTNDQVEAVTKRGNRTIKGLCTHRQIDPETRTDPGNNYPYDLLLAGIRFYMNQTTEEEDDMFTQEDRNRDARNHQILEAFETDLIRQQVIRLYKAAGSDTIYVLEGGKLRWVSPEEWDLLGKPKPAIRTKAQIDAMPKVVLP